MVINNTSNWLITLTEDTVAYVSNNEYEIFIEGYLTQRKGVVVNSSDKYEIVFQLLEKYKFEFINYVKGNYIIIVKNNGKYRIYSDRFAVRKFFYWNDNNNYIITNSVKEITSRIGTKLSKQNMAIYALTYHFTGGKTAFENINHNQPAEYISIEGAKLKINIYWNPLDLLKQPRKNISIKDISNSLSEAVKSTLPKDNNISLSLTGGADTRNLLAIMLSLGKNPHLYTYGNPKSDDCIAASNIAKGLKLKYDIHDIQMTPELFDKYARIITNTSGGLASIHRAHRIMSVEIEAKYAKDMYLGTLGGEYIKGVSEDNYIVPPVIYENWNTTQMQKENLVHLFNNKCINYNNIDVEDYLNYINSEPFMIGTSTERKFQALTYVTAHLHDAQDVNLYRTEMDEVYTPFLDIDYMELIFQSEFTFNNKEEISNKYLKRIENPIYGSKFVYVTHKPLTKFLYAGLHKPSEVLCNKYYATVAKIIRKKLASQKPANFPLSQWMEEFIEKNLPLCKNNAEIAEVFNIDKMIEDFKTEKHILKESYWLKYTNPIMMNFIAEELL